MDVLLSVLATLGYVLGLLFFGTAAVVFTALCLVPLAVRVLSIKKGVAFSPDGMGGNTAIACLSGLACIDGMATYMAFICLINLTGSRP